MYIFEAGSRNITLDCWRCKDEETLLAATLCTKLIPKQILGSVRSDELYDSRSALYLMVVSQPQQHGAQHLPLGIQLPLVGCAGAAAYQEQVFHQRLQCKDA